MATRLVKRLLEAADLKSTDRVLEVLNPLLESYSGALAGGLSLDNLRHVTVTANLTPPDEWTPLELTNGSAVFLGGQWGVPAVRWNAGNTEYRGMLTKAATGPGDVARIPDSVATLRPRTSRNFGTSASNKFTGVDVLPDGTVRVATPSPIVAGDFLALNSLSHEGPKAPPLWPTYEDVKLAGEGGKDYGTPFLVLALGATRKDRVACAPELIPTWEAPLISGVKTQERKLRIRRVGGLEAGVEHRVTFLCLYE